MPRIYIMEYELFSKHPEWSTVLFIVETLKNHGHLAVLAGGCVRDALLGKLAKDLDVATDASPDQIETYFQKVLPLGKSFGVCRVVQGGHSIEVATFREESDYRDGRRPSQVEYSTIEKDAERRDFTINALFYDISKKQIIDCVDGREDLKNKVLRCVGDPDRRFSEDHLRILRGVRFFSQLEFSIEEATALSLKKHVVLLPRISRERIYDELNKMFVPYAISHCWRGLAQFQILEVLLPEWDFLKKLKLIAESVAIEQAMERVQKNIKKDSSLFGWTVCYHFRSQQLSGKAIDKEFMELKLPRATVDMCRSIIDALSCLTKSGDEALRAFIAATESRCLESAELYWDAVLNSQVFSDKIREFKLNHCTGGELPVPIVTGTDLIKNGVSQGPGMKTLLQSIYLLQLKERSKNKEDLMREILFKKV